MGNYAAASAPAYAAADANATMMIQHACEELAVAACLALMENHAAASADTEANPTTIQHACEELSVAASLPQLALKGCYS